MGRSLYVIDLVRMGMGIVLRRYLLTSAQPATKPARAFAIDFDHRIILGPLVGNQTQALITRGAEAC